MRTRIDNKGYWIQNYSDAYIENYYSSDNNWIFTKNEYDSDLQYVKPKLVNNIWIEEATQEEVKANKTPRYKDSIENAFSYLYTRALASSMNKSNLNREFLEAQKEAYKKKFDVSSHFLNTGYVFSDDISLVKSTITTGTDDEKNVLAKTYLSTLKILKDEMDTEFSEVYLNNVLNSYGIIPTGTHFNKMFQLVIFKFKSGSELFDDFFQFIEVFRTKSLTWLDGGFWGKLDGAIAIVKGAPNSLTLTEAETLYNQFNSL